MRRDKALEIANITKHHYYYKAKKEDLKPKRSIRLFGVINNDILIKEIKKIKDDPDVDYGYVKMTCALKIKGYFVNISFDGNQRFTQK